MNAEHEISQSKQVYYRLIALWVLCEAFLGGIIHGFKIPVSGLVVGSGAIICICLIAFYVPVKGAIIKATIIVAIFKMMLSPQSPPAAYFAVLFQGCLGQLLFINLRFYKISCVILGLLSMVESAIQRILVLVILYGTELWNAVDQFLMRLTGQQEITNYSFLFATGYLIVHAIVGLLVGWFASILVLKSKKWNLDKRYLIEDIHPLENIKRTKQPSKRVRFTRLSLFIIWVLLIIAYLQSISGIGHPILPAHVSLQILVRSLLIVLSWYFFVGPLVLMLMKKWLDNQKANRQGDIQQVMQILPYTKELVRKSWHLAKGNSRWERLKNSIKIVLVNALQSGHA
jgi:hypothetical protein